jgi:filamin
MYLTFLPPVLQVSGNVKNGFTAEFLPEEVGPYTVCVEYNGIPVGGTPFIGKAYDSANVLVSPIPWGTIGKSLQFTVDASKAGEGNLEITISARGRNIPTQVHPQGSARFAVSFVPLEAIDHVINITFNKEPVPGAPFTAKIHTDPNHIVVSGQSLAATAVGKTSFFTLSNVSGSLEDIEVSIDSPTGEEVPAQVLDLGAGSFKAEFCPKMAGEHQIYISFRDEQVPGSPFACKVYNVNAIKVRECAKGIVGKPVTFLVETSHAGPGNLEVTVNNGQVPTSAQAQGNHTYAISFNPKEAKPHIVELKFNGESVPGSPFKCLVVDAAKVNLSGDGLEKVPVGRQTSFIITGQGDMGDPEVKILSPLRDIVTSSIRCVREGQYEVDYAPEMVGDHTVEVKMAGLHVHGSPFIVKAYDASQVIVTDIQTGSIGKPVYFSIDASQAGAGNLEIIVSVNAKNVPNYVQSEGNAKFKVNFKPQESASHFLSVKFNNEPVPNSPFECRIIDGQELTISGPGVKMCPVSLPARINILSSSGISRDCIVKVHSPGGEILPLAVVTSDRLKTEYEYRPSEVGAHHVHVVLDGQPVVGSPFTCNVYDVGRVLVTGLQGSHAVGLPVTFTVDASQAGEGTLELVVTTGKSSVRAEVAARSRGLYEVTFVPQEAIPHFVNITFNDEGIPNNPFQCQIVAAAAAKTSLQRGPRKISEVRSTIARGDALKQAVYNAKSVFEIDTMGADLPPVVKITDPYSFSVSAFLTETRPGLYRVEFTPTKLGTHAIMVAVGDRPIADSPFKTEVFDPASVRVTDIGPAVIGRESSLTVDVSSAGHGALSVAVRTAGQEVGCFFLSYSFPFFA